MFVLELAYTAAEERVDEVLAEHAAWLDAQYAAGVFLASGRKVPREGGMILAVAPDRAAVEALVASDPFAVKGVAVYRVIEFRATKTAAALEAYREEPA